MYPWGDVPGCKAGDMACLEKSAIDGSHCPLLQQHTQGDQEGLANVTAYPQGASPFGVMDLVGNVSGAVVVTSLRKRRLSALVCQSCAQVWQFTDEFEDEHTRAALTRGGSHYYPVVNPASHWYYPNDANMCVLIITSEPCVERIALTSVAASGGS